MERTWKADYEKFVRTARENVAATLDNMDYPALERAAELILAAKAAGKRLHISGIGKPAHLAGYAASLFSSTGTPAYFLHGTEAVHGSCGQLVPGDVVIFISNSGETAEMKATVSAVKNNGCRVIGITGNAESWLAKESDALLLLCPNFNDAVSANITAFFNRLTNLLVLRDLSEKYVFAIVVSGYSGSDLVARQILGAMSMNKGAILPPQFCLMQTANDPGSAQKSEGIAGRLDAFAAAMQRSLCQPAGNSSEISPNE